MLRVSLIALFLSVSLCAEKKPVTIDAVMEQSREHEAPQAVWAPDGKRFAYFQSGEVMLYDIPAKSQKKLLLLGPLEKAAVPVPEPARFDWQNRHVAAESLEWSPSGKQLLLAVYGDLFWFSIDSGDWQQLTATPEAEADPKLSPDGSRVAFRRGHDLYALDIASRELTRLTEDGSATLLNGELDWVYPEELNLGTAYWWSPDSKHVAYMQFDIAHEFVYPQTSLTGLRGIAEPERYPQAGTPNADVRVGVVGAKGGATRWMDLGEPRGFLIARVYWAPDSARLAIERLNRVQNHLDLFLAEAGSGEAHVILSESDSYWINVNDLFSFVGKNEFLWGSERDGFQHLYLYSLEGHERKRLTEGDWEVTELAGIDESHEKVYYWSTEASPLERQLYSVKLNGKDRTKISREAGTHQVSLGPKAQYYLDSFSSFTEPPRVDVHEVGGERWSTWQAPKHAADEYALQPAETVEIKAQDGKKLYGSLIKPAKFRAGEKYPAIVMVYGGPGIQDVVNAWQGAGWEQVMAARGFVVWRLDNRGSTGRGHAFETPLYRRFGKTELEDQLEGVRYLVAQGFVDPARVGIYGWSYGGFMTLYSLLNAPDVFRAGAAGAPVTNWRNYDTIYTERYLGLPAENAEGYRASSPVDYAAKLRAKLLLLHNIEDDNVLFQNTVQMDEALEQAGKLFEQVIYTGKSHGVTGPARRQLLETLTEFFEKNLK
ncbi:MAG TPA: S9 family peptidase [Bryobacteraceae bacterium]|nr:S9 family peptidase [Bryobacteraceae bacterium]